MNRLPAVRVPLLGGRIAYLPRGEDAALSARMLFATRLRAVHRNQAGDVLGEYDLGSGLVTHAGVRLLSQDTAISAGAATLNVMKYHGSGTGTTAATDLDVALQTAIGTAATAGTNTNADASPNATVTATGTVSYTGTAAVTEWGLFNSATLAGATMWDHKVFAAVNVANGDSITFTYTLTINSAG